AAVDKLTRQAQRHLGRRRERKRRPHAAAEPRRPSSAASGGDGQAPRVIRSRRFVAKPMTMDEAVLEGGASGGGPVVCRDGGPERVSVLYRRKDGNLGLIEPEA